MLIKRNSIFLLDKEKGKTDAKLRFRVQWSGGNQAAFSVGFRVDIDKWSTESQRCKANTTHGKKKISASIINKEIQTYYDTSERIFSEYQSNKTPLTTIIFKDAFNELLNKKSKKKERNLEKNIFYIIEEFKEEVGKSNMWTNDTYSKFSALKNHLLSFNKSLSFDDLNEQGLNKLVSHLINVCNLRNTTVIKQIGFLKWFLKWAVKRKHTTQEGFKDFLPRLKTAEKKVIFLDWDELMKVYNKEFPSNHSSLERVRDVFCFCCFTSLRYSDVENLRRSDVYENYISVTTLKTNDSIKIELNKYSSAILEKYKNFTFSKDKALPVISNQKMNAALKELGRICDIAKPITITYYKGNKRIDGVYPKYALLSTHAGRRTFICNALTLGIPPQTVMKWTGHSDYKAMKPYIDIADKARAEAMQLFNK